MCQDYSNMEQFSTLTDFLEQWQNTTEKGEILKIMQHQASCDPNLAVKIINSVTTNQPTNQTNKQPINQSINQSTNQQAHK